MTSKEFEECLQLKNFDVLEQQYQEAKKFFLNLHEQITYDEIEQKFPAFCLGKQEIRIKFPTFFIRIIDNQITYSQLEKLLKGQGNYFIYEEPNVVRMPTLEPVHSLAVHCLETSLSDNKWLADRIENMLKGENIGSERCVSSGHYRIPIKVDENGYISLRN